MFAFVDYLVKSFELAFTRLISQKIDKLPENQYLELEKLVSEKKFSDIEKILKGDELSQKLNGAILQDELKKIFNM
ncbi:hypothetical protein IT401_00620 [Candidatus Nomurabacteria bacterium]|nr:hypothetical protein [Candidatus Nomurabacteria bacterium]